MNWGKIILIFQAIITLIIGIVFIAESFIFSSQYLSQAITSADPAIFLQGFQDISLRFKLGGFVTLVVSLIEMLILSRL